MDNGKKLSPYGKAYLIELIESAITNGCFGDDDSAYKAWDIILCKLKDGYGLYTMENEMVQKWLTEMARAEGTEFTPFERQRFANLAAVKRW